MSDFTKLAEQYIAAWNETDPAARRALIDAVWAEDGCYIDPLAEVTGRDQIDAVIAAAQQQFAGMTFRLAGAVDAHHDQARFTWSSGPTAPTSWSGSTWPCGTATDGWRLSWVSSTRCHRPDPGQPSRIRCCWRRAIASALERARTSLSRGRPG